MAIFQVILDKRIHRIVKLGENISKDSNYTIVPVTDGRKNYFDVTLPGGRPQRWECEKLFTPPNVGVKILTSSSSEQPPCDLDDSLYRTLELGTELSTVAGVSAIVINCTDPATALPDDYLLFADRRGMHKIITSRGTKIPPNTDDLAHLASTAEVKVEA